MPFRLYLPASLVLLLSPVTAFTQITPSLQQATVSVAPMAGSAPAEGTVWLQLRNRAALDQVEAALYTPGSPTFHQFLSSSDLAPYLPTAAQLGAVKAELAANHLSVVSSDSMSVRFSGTMAAFEAAFHTTAEQHTLHSGETVRAFTATPALGNGAAGLVLAVTGVGATADQPDLAPPMDPVSGKRLGVQTLAQAQAETTQGAPYYCFFAPGNAVLTTPGSLTPYAVYSGPLYSRALDNGKLQSVDQCGYTPAAYFYQTGLDKIHAAGYTGTGQTIAIIESGGSPTLAADVQAFDQTYGLPAANLQIIDQTTANDQSPDAISETTLDVEWAHAVAPDAKIIVLDEDGNRILDGVEYAVTNGLAGIISVSYGKNEISAASGEVDAYNAILEVAASRGISADFSGGDYGDQVANEGKATVNVPSDSPYATGVGGLSQAYLPGTTVLEMTSWGTNRTRIGTGGVPLAVPAPIAHTSDKFGGGGGVSALFPKPAYQSALTGNGRHVPDIADIADGFTGLKIIITDPANCSSNPCSEIEGGTSLAAPVFSGKWALLNQLLGASYGKSPAPAFGPTLGQAAPLIAQSAGSGAVEDITPQPSGEVAGAVLTSAGVTGYSGTQLAFPGTSQPFVSALWQERSGDDYVISFGTDSSLAVTPGYDFATGWGTLDMAKIFAAFGVGQ